MDIIVQQEIEKEIVELRERQLTIDGKAFDLTGERDALEHKLAKAKNPKPEDLAKLTALDERILSSINAGVNISQRITTLRSPGEHERRVNKRLATADRISDLRERRPSVAKETAKDQGFPEVYLNEAGNFKIGMDARAKSDLVASSLGLITKDEPGAALHVFTAKEADDLIAKRGWQGFKERKQQLLAEKETARQASEAKREEAARARAAEKEKKAAEREQEKAAKAAEKQAADVAKASEAKAAGQAAPDPKGGKGNRSRSSAGATK